MVLVNFNQLGKAKLIIILLIIFGGERGLTLPALALSSESGIEMVIDSGGGVFRLHLFLLDIHLLGSRDLLPRLKDCRNYLFPLRFLYLLIIPKPLLNSRLSYKEHHYLKYWSHPS